MIYFLIPLMLGSLLARIILGGKPGPVRRVVEHPPAIREVGVFLRKVEL